VFLAGFIRDADNARLAHPIPSRPPREAECLSLLVCNTARDDWAGWDGAGDKTW